MAAHQAPPSLGFSRQEHWSGLPIFMYFESPGKLQITCLLSNLCAGQEATVRTGHGTTDWFQIGKGVHQHSVLSPCLFNLYAEWKWKLISLVWLFATPWTIYSPWNSPGQNTGVGSLSLLQGIFPTQESSRGLLHCRWILYQLSYEGSLNTDWMKPKLESRLQGEISIISDMQMTPPLYQKVKRTVELKSLLNESGRGEWKSWLKTHHSKN